ncbi:hypothetical protein [Nocardioides sp. SYSU DS0651]|uniref:hypothetical protein n=1 Tax=Nocardioides sp. SYSU DS0651 TaxID=3415955 RepID=UPI003F4B1BBD
MSSPPLLRSALVAALATSLAASLAACGDEPGPTPRAVDGPTTLQPDDGPATPAGYERVTCEVETADRSVTVVLDVPVGTEPPDVEGTGPSHSCAYYPQSDGVPEIRVVLLHGDDQANDDVDIASLADMEAGFDELYGEEAVANVDWEQDVVALGETVGNRLTWTSEYEGIPEWNFRAEADGVQVWLTAQGEEFDGAEMEQTFEHIASSVREG